ncbi:hypothetical protein L6164_015625 [Bauhinia variegata]|uniref:Uncharacterized protein n=1 Tax=Bauhinia variegata TaxID=167791 RepID=A0ACB9NL73_BAUVA|nr:hypothetical protein L6164_015625 [Bauhinia variegata]
MASVSMAMSVTCSQNRVNQQRSEAFLKALPVKQSNRVVSKSKLAIAIQASLKEKAVTGLTAAALTASMVIPEVAQAAGSDVSPSLENFLLSIVAGGVVLAALFGAVIGVANFDPVKRV